MENQPWSSIKGNSNCPYINKTLLPQASSCENYFSPRSLHPTLPNYLWLVAGTNFGIRWNVSPWGGVQDTTNHLAARLDAAGVSWKHYEAGLAGLSYPQTNIVYPYHPSFNPFLFFRNILTNAEYGQAHIRPHEELAQDLTNNNVARFNIISPGLWDSGHDSGPAGADLWLSGEVPMILASDAYKNGGALFITWDEDDFSAVQGALGMFVLSSIAKGNGYTNNISYTHSSTLRTMQNIFGAYPYLGDAANATDLSDLFRILRMSALGGPTNGSWTFRVENATPARTYHLQACSDFDGTAWENLSTNVATATDFLVTDEAAVPSQRFYRISESPQSLPARIK